MELITDEFMQNKLKETKQYCMCILKSGPNPNIPDADKIQWEHVRKNLQLREEGILLIVLPVTDSGDIKG